MYFKSNLHSLLAKIELSRKLWDKLFPRKERQCTKYALFQCVWPCILDKRSPYKE